MIRSAERIDNRLSGRWIKHDGDFHDSRECSACHVWMPWDMNYTNYCPHCGAKMDKGKNESEECRACRYNDGKPHAECVLCTKDVAKEEPTIDEVIAKINKQE